MESHWASVIGVGASNLYESADVVGDVRVVFHCNKRTDDEGG